MRLLVRSTAVPATVGRVTSYFQIVRHSGYSGALSLFSACRKPHDNST